MDVKLETLEYDTSDILYRAEQGIKITKQALEQLKFMVVDQKFGKAISEIEFFKNIKPKVFSKLIYYVKLFSIESKRPRGSSKSQIKYFNMHIERLQTYFNENLDFYHYHRRGATVFDEQYFLRGTADLRLFPDNFHCFTDENFSTGHDSTVATILAYDLLIVYLKREIDKLETISNGTELQAIQKTSNFTWTSQKVDLIELIYALQSTDAINNGAVDIKDIARVIERIFKIDLGDFYRAFLEIRMRKKGRTKFLDLLKENLEKRMEEIDD